MYAARTACLMVLRSGGSAKGISSVGYCRAPDGLGQDEGGGPWPTPFVRSAVARGAQSSSVSSG